MVVIGQKHPSATTRESCSATDRMSSVSKDVQSELVLSHSTHVSILRSPLDGIQPRNCFQELLRRRVSFYKKLTLLPLIGDPNSILVRHRKFLKQLETQKNLEREEQMDANASAQVKNQRFKDQAAKQRDKIRGLKGVEPENEDYD